jgi:hypothetical protein
MLWPSAGAALGRAGVLVSVRGVAGAGGVVMDGDVDAAGRAERAVPESPAAAQPARARARVAVANAAVASAAAPVPQILMLMETVALPSRLPSAVINRVEAELTPLSE